jgi:hypothetical protein
MNLSTTVSIYCSVSEKIKMHRAGFKDRLKKFESRYSAKKFSKSLTRKHGTLGGIPPNTAMQHHTDWGGGSGPLI